MKTLCFERITALRGTRPLAVQLRTVSGSLFRAPCAASKTTVFLTVYL